MTNTKRLPLRQLIRAALLSLSLGLTGLPVYAGTFDISGSFNTDTLALNPVAEAVGGGYRGQTEAFRNFPVSGTLSTGTADFSVGPFDDVSAAVQLNTVLLDHGASVNIPLVGADQQMYSQISVLFSAVGYNPSDTNNGSATIHFNDASSQTFIWDVADSDGNDQQGLSTPVINTLILQRNSNLNLASGRRAYQQDFLLDPGNVGKVVESITFDASGFNDSGNAAGDADFGIYSLYGLEGTPPPPQVPTNSAILLPSAALNNDGFATSEADAAGVGFLGTQNNKFLTDTLPSGRLLGSPDGSVHQLDEYDNNNVAVIGLNQSMNIDIIDGNYSEISVLHTAVGFNTIAGQQNTTNGNVTVNYSDGSTDSFVWDVADNDGNNGQGDSTRAVDDLSLRRQNPAGTFTGRGMWTQLLAVDPTKTVDSLSFNTNGVQDGGGTDAEFGVFGLSGSIVTGPWQPVEISAGQYNADTLATSTSDSTGDGYRAGNEMFLTNELPDGQHVEVGEVQFALGDFDGNNTVKLGLDEMVTIDVEDRAFDAFSVLHTAVGFNVIGGNNLTHGSVEFHYADGTVHTFVWDVSDNDGNNSQGMSTDAVEGLVLRNLNTGAQAIGRQFWMQTFDLDASLILDSIKFSTMGVIDGAGADAEFGIYALSGSTAIPVPSAGLMGLAMLGSLAIRRRRP